MRISKIKYLFSSVIVVVICLINCKVKLFPINIESCISEKSVCTFCIMTFNVNAYDTVPFTRQFQDSLLAEIHRQKADIICFQELSFENLKMIKPQLDSIYGPCAELDGRDVEIHRNKFYSHFTMRNFKRYHCEGTIDTSDFDSLELKEYEIMRKQMDVMSAEFEVQPSKWITGIPLYYRNYKVGKRIRDYQARNVRRFIDEARAEGKTVVLAGDLNDWCGSTTLNTLMGEGENALKDAWWEGGNGFGFTYQGWHLRLRLDHILYSDGLKLNDVKVIDSDFSDHRPLKATFTISENI